MANQTDIEDFHPMHRAALDHAIAKGMEYYDIEGAKVLFIGCGIAQVKESDELYEPHLSFFPWASKRQIFSAIKEIINHLTKTKHMLVQCRDKYAAHYDRWVAHGIGRKVGVLENMSYGSLHIYQVSKQ